MGPLREVRIGESDEVTIDWDRWRLAWRCRSLWKDIVGSSEPDLVSVELPSIACEVGEMCVGLEMGIQGILTTMGIEHGIDLGRPSQPPRRPVCQFHKQEWITPVCRGKNGGHRDQGIPRQHLRVGFLEQGIIHHLLRELESPSLGEAIIEALSGGDHHQGVIEVPQLREPPGRRARQLEFVLVGDIITQ